MIKVLQGRQKGFPSKFYSTIDMSYATLKSTGVASSVDTYFHKKGL